MQGAFTADFLFSIERRLRINNEFGYMNMLASSNIWYPRLLRDSPIDGKSERVIWLLSTASIEQLTAADGGESGGSINFDELATISQEYFPAYFARGYKIGKLRYMNFLNGGVDPVGKWAQDIGTYGAYLPQRLLAIAILNGGSVLGYDGVNFFSKLHPNHPLIPALGTYANDFTGSSAAASGLTPAYPGALPIDDSVTLDVAYTNFSKALSYITGAISQPNGAGDPRFLEPAFLIHPPRMSAQVHQLLDAQYIARAVGSAGGSSDVSKIWSKYQMAEPILAKELDGSRSYTLMSPATGLPTTVTGNDTTWYLVCREANETQLGAFLQTRRMPFSMHTYSGESGAEGIDAVLGRSQDLEWHYDGATAVNYGHPYAVFRFQGS